jgi:hypothetical protein
MPRVRLFHWREEEAKPLIAELRKAGFTVDYDSLPGSGSFRSMAERDTAAAVIDLTRLPSHGRAVAAELRARKTLRHIPIVFVDGAPEKVAAIRKELPDAIYTTRANLPAAIRSARAPADPVQPARMMDRRDRTTAQKMGIRENARVAVIDAPPGYAKVLGPMPAGVSLEEDPVETLPLTIWFVSRPEAYQAGLPGMRARMARTRLWVVYPKAGAKKTAEGGVNQFFIRQQALALGMVDYKICSVNESWTGMLFTLKKR